MRKPCSHKTMTTLSFFSPFYLVVILHPHSFHSNGDTHVYQAQLPITRQLLLFVFTLCVCVCVGKENVLVYGYFWVSVGLDICGCKCKCVCVCMSVCMVMCICMRELSVSGLMTKNGL